MPRTKRPTIIVKAKMYKPPANPTKQGIKVEKEHTPSRRIAGIIASHHQAEDKQYYPKLAKMEKSSKKSLAETKKKR